MIGTNNIDEFANFIFSAARLQREYQTRQQTQRFLADDPSNFVIYAVDTDVVKILTNPALTGPSDEKTGKQGYGKVFQTDSTHDATAIAASLGRFIFFHLNEHFPIVQLPSQYEETQIVYSAVARDAKKEIEWRLSLAEQLKAWRKDLNKDISVFCEDIIKSFGDIIQEKHTNTQQKENSLENDINDLVDLVLGHSRSYFREFTRYTELIAEGSLLSIDNFRTLLSNEFDGFDELVAALEAPKSLTGWVQESSRVEFWLKKLTAEKSRRQPIHRTEVDAYGLARFENLNEKLDEIGGRLVLITGDRHLKNVVQKANQKLGAECIIHPTAFLVDSISIAKKHTNQENKERLDTWLNAILLKYTYSSKIDINELSDLVEKKPDSVRELKRQISQTSPVTREDIYTKARLSWNELKTPLLIWNLALSDDGGSQFKEILLEAAENKEKVFIARTLRELGAAAENKFDRIWDQLLIAFSTAGIGLIYAIKDGESQARPFRSRNPPVVEFGSFPTATQLVGELVSRRNFDETGSPIENQLKNLRNDTFTDKLGNTDFAYVNCIVFATLCAAEGKWPVANGLALRAIRIAESGKIQTKPGSSISGREAYYLYSISNRLMSKKISDLKKVRDQLIKAKELLTQDKNSNPKNTIKEYRFDAELIATDVTELHYTIWEKEPARKDGAILFTCKTISKANDLIKEIEEDEYISNISASTTFVNLFINILQLSHIGLVLDYEKFVKLINDNKSIYEELSSVTRVIMEENSNLHKTYLISVYLLLYDSFFGKKKIAKDFMIYVFDDETIDEYKFMSYDKKRFTNLKMICNKILAN